MAGETILIVDDDAQARAWLAETVLKPRGYATVECEDLEAAVQESGRHTPDLVILSLQAPWMTGPECIGRFSLKGEQPPILLKTDRQPVPWIVDALQAGARGLLAVPCDREQAARQVERALAEGRLRRERDDLADKLIGTRRQMDWQLQELNALYTVGKTVTAVLDLEKVLAQVIEAATYMTHAEEGTLMLLDPATGELYLRAAKNIEQHTLRGLRIRVDDSLLGSVVKSGRPVLMSGQDLQKVKAPYLVQSLLEVPLKVPPDRIIGILGVSNRFSDRSFTERDVFLLSALADYAAIAIENARLFAEAETERNKLETVLRGTEDAVIVLDRDRRVLLCNPAAGQAFGLELPGATAPASPDSAAKEHAVAAPSVIGRPLTEIIHSQPLLDLFEQLPTVGRAARTEVQLTDGRTLQAQVSSIDGVGSVAVMQDITHLKELDRIKSEFVFIVSHDLRSPLTTIRGYVDLLSRVGPLTPQQIEFVSRIERSMKTVTDLIGDLLDIGRIEAGLDQEARLCDLASVVRLAVETIQMSVDAKHQSLAVELEPDLAAIMGSAGRLHQVVLNLLNNAVKYTPEGGHVEVRLHAEGPYLMLEVRDTGIGIPLEDQPYVFDKFYRVRSEQTEAIGGTGLGLSIVKSLVEKHDGRVWFESTPGQGSIFFVLLPIHPKDDSPAITSAE